MLDGFFRVLRFYQRRTAVIFFDRLKRSFQVESRDNPTINQLFVLCLLVRALVCVPIHLVEIHLRKIHLRKAGIWARVQIGHLGRRSDRSKQPESEGAGDQKLTFSVRGLMRHREHGTYACEDRRNSTLSEEGNRNLGAVLAVFTPEHSGAVTIAEIPFGADSTFWKLEEKDA